MNNFPDNAPEAAQVATAIDHARREQADVEAARKAAGGVYDPILKRWVPSNV